MTYLVKTVLLIFLIYCFEGIIALIPRLLGVVISIFSFPVSLASSIYPVGFLPYLVVSVFPILYLVMYIIPLFKH